MTALPHDCLIDGPEDKWELGTRDTGSYATISDVISYIEWLGEQCPDAPAKPTRRDKFMAAGKAIHGHEQALTNAMINGTGNLAGLAEMDEVNIIGGANNPAREGLVAITVDSVASVDVVAKLNAEGIRTHLRKADHFSGTVLTPLGLDSCIRVSMCHYNSIAEVAQFLTVMRGIVEGRAADG
jgi:selenocysteine lyase/cysteine desulfurase